MELDADDSTSARSGSQPVRKNIHLKLKQGKGRGRKGKGRRGSKKAEKQQDEDEDITEEKVLDNLPNLKPEPFFCAPKISWEHKVTLIGEKVVDPLIHCCEKCDLPILVYGRMIPCKHVFCLDCAKRTEKYCQRCQDPVSRIEQSALGTVFICTGGGSKHGVSGCRRTYLSQRDLQAHINYRHLGRQAEPRHGEPRLMEYLPQPPSLPLPPGLQLMPPQPGFRVEDGSHMQVHLPPPPAPQLGHLPPPPPQPGHPPLPVPPPQGHMSAPPTSSHIESYHTIPVMSTNLITVQIQEEDFQRRDQGGNYLPPPGPGPFSQSQSPTRSAPPLMTPLPYPPSMSSPPPVSFAPYTSGGPPPHSHPHLGPPPGQRPPLLSQPPPMVPHPGGPPPPRPVPPVSSHGPMPSPHANYPSPHHHDPPPSFSQPGQPDSHGPSHWSGAPGAPGCPAAPPPRPPPPTRTATSSAGGMGQPPPGSYYQ